MGGGLLSMPSGGQISLDEENGREREREKMQEGIDNKQGKGDQEMACCGAQKGQKVVDEAKKWHASMCYEEGKQEASIKEGHFWERERETEAWQVNTLFPHWPAGATAH